MGEGEGGVQQTILNILNKKNEEQTIWKYNKIHSIDST